MKEKRWMMDNPKATQFKMWDQYGDDNDITNDIDSMENLGIYEVAPEDFALTEFICVSKQPHQNIIREGLDLMKKEIG